jgi:hypothetical protein
MSFSDPQSVTVATVAKSLPRISQNGGTAIYREATSDPYQLRITQKEGKRANRLVKLSSKKVSSDPYLPSTNVDVLCHVTVILDAPPAGFTVQDQIDLLTAMADWLKAGTNASKLTSGES